MSGNLKRNSGNLGIYKWEFVRPWPSGWRAELTSEGSLVRTSVVPTVWFRTRVSGISP